MEIRTVLLHLSLIDKVGPATVEKLFQALTAASITNYSALYSFTIQDLMYYGHLSQNTAQRIKEGLSDKALLEKELALSERSGIKLITIIDADYPELLKAIHLPPLTLYVQGDLTILQNRALALVGARKADSYGYSMIKKIVPELVAQKWTLISGGALGIDSMVHKATLEAQGSTIAVLGSGLLKPYPSCNTALFHNIAERGALISSFPLQMSALAGNFPARNRIISGLSKGCIIVQAAQQSGALITARYALEQGREVMAVPGPVDNPLAAGCHALIQEGASLVTSAQDIFSVLGYTSSVNKKQSEESAKPLGMSDQVLSYLVSSLSFDELLVKTGLPETELRDILWDLQLEGRVTQDFMGLWSII